MTASSRHRWYISPRSSLLLTVFASVFFLFFAAFSVPYLDFVYFVQADLGFGVGFVTLGTFGFCSELYGQQKICSPGAAGYQLSEYMRMNLFTRNTDLFFIQMTLLS